MPDFQRFEQIPDHNLTNYDILKKLLDFLSSNNLVYKIGIKIAMLRDRCYSRCRKNDVKYLGLCQIYSWLCGSKMSINLLLPPPLLADASQDVVLSFCNYPNESWRVKNGALQTRAHSVKLRFTLLDLLYPLRTNVLLN